LGLVIKHSRWLGKLGGMAEVRDLSGTWKELTDNVNQLNGNLTVQLRDVSKVATAIAQGDLGQKITVEARGEILQIKETINNMIDILAMFADQVTTVAREVGTEGKLGGQARVKGVNGTWKDLTVNVNLMAGNLTDQVRNIAEVTTAVARGDLSRKITVNVKGEVQELKETINTMVDQLGSFASEVSRVTREVGTNGTLGGQAVVPGVSGTWEDLTDNVNQLAGNLTVQLRDVSKVARAVALGDLSKKITVDAQGEIHELKETINTMVDQLSLFASEVLRVAREVGVEGKLGGQAEVQGMSGTWENLTDNVNLMADNLTEQVRSIAEVTTAVAKGDLSKKITITAQGEIHELKETINTMVDRLSSFASEVTRVAREVGTEGKLGGQADVPGVSGTWKDLTDNVNQLTGNLTIQLRDVSKVATAIAHGDLSRKITVDVKGEILQIKETINTMVDQLGSFASEVTRVAREVGTDGELGGQARVAGVSGTWKDLTDNVNLMAGNLTDQVRGIAKIVTAVARGDLTKKLIVDAKGEIASLADIINNMIDTLAIFADQVTTVSREVGTEGKLGGQAKVPGASGIWGNLTDNVNQLADNLTTQVRAIADVATAVTDGDLTRSITVETRGEVEELKNNINEMIQNLRETTHKNTEQDWLKTNLARFTRMLQGQKNLQEISRLLLSELAPVVSAQHAVFYSMERNGDTSGEHSFNLLASYGYRERKPQTKKFEIGEGLIGQCAYEKERILLNDVPADYIQITSGLGEATPINIAILPVVFENEVKGVIELASFRKFSETHLSFLEQLTESIGIVLNTIKTTMQTESLLEQSQTLAADLQHQQEDLQQANEELEDKARTLAEQKAEVENKNQQVEFAKVALEEKAEQLQLTSKYKSEFLANMSHELRTPLNSLLILSEQLKNNPDANLDEKEVVFAETIHAAGTDLLNLINDILDLSKIESGTVSIDLGKVRLEDIKESIKRTFRHMADTKKGLEFSVVVDNGLPEAIFSDRNRVEQILKNLLSNAFKFTEKGLIELRVSMASKDLNFEAEMLAQAESVIAFRVRDTGIGIPAEKQKIIFEAFQQAEGSTSRRFGGTGLGLAISRELASLLGGELHLTDNKSGKGSAFTLYVPLTYILYENARVEPEKTDPSPPPPVASQQLEGQAPGNLKLLSETPVEENLVYDDRDEIGDKDQVVLIIEDDKKFAASLREVARSRGCKSLIAAGGQEALTLVREYRPDLITLDLRLKDMDGWTVLDRFKLSPDTRHIPICIISSEDEGHFGLTRGAYSYLTKPASRTDLEDVFSQASDFIARKSRSLLVVEDDEKQQKAITDLLGDKTTEITAVGTGKKALDQLKKERFDAVILDLKLQDKSGFRILDEIEKTPDLHRLPVIIYTKKNLTQKDESRLKKLATRIIVKTVRSPERLLDEACLFLHKPVSDFSAARQKMLQKIYESGEGLAGKKVLAVDDDIRNIFALSVALKRHDIEVTTAENGKEALKILENDPGMDMILMDIMMPEMDGYETIREIRKKPKFECLPILALTAKAMKGDREKCLGAGASDYISKPVDIDQLVSLMRVRLYK
ncbi:MAG: response regulator, partial [Balneolales bacterium]